MSIINHIVIVLLWIVFCVSHSVLATARFKRKMQVRLGADYKYYRFLYSLFALDTLILVLVFQFNMKSVLLFAVPVWIKWIFWLPLLAGVSIMAIVIRKYFFSLSGISVFFKKQPQDVLEQGGLNRYVRHPLYAGTLLFIWALFLLMPFLKHLLAGIIITIYTITGAHREEKKLEAQFGELYLNYKKHVPMIIPWKRGANGEW